MRGGMMKLLVSMALVAGLVCAACGGGDAGKTYPATGIVRQVDVEKGQVVIDHDEIPGLMQAMQMRFEADPELLKGVEPGQQVHFTLVHEGGTYEVTEISAHGG
jgi:Cu/Ag efflux protein CusF